MAFPRFIGWILVEIPEYSSQRDGVVLAQYLNPNRTAKPHVLQGQANDIRLLTHKFSRSHLADKLFRIQRSLQFCHFAWRGPMGWPNHSLLLADRIRRGGHTFLAFFTRLKMTKWPSWRLSSTQERSVLALVQHPVCSFWKSHPLQT
jgi:hypothetical protein